jgi:hypothetical protein
LEIIVLPNKARPTRALAFRGRPPNSKFTSAIVMVKKQDRDDLRFCDQHIEK